MDNTRRLDDAERVVICRALLEPKIIAAIDRSIDGARHFAPENREAWRAASDTAARVGMKSVGLDVFIAYAEERGDELIEQLGGADALAAFYHRAKLEDVFRPSLEMCTEHAHRQSVSMGLDRLGARYSTGDTDAAGVRHGVEDLLTGATAASPLSACDPAEVTREATRRFQAMMDGTIPALHTGLEAIDGMLGLRTGLYGLIVGESGAGKSTLVGDIAVRLHEVAGAVITWHSCEIDPTVAMWRLGASWSANLGDDSLRLDERRCVDPTTLRRVSMSEYEAHLMRMQAVGSWFSSSRIYLHPAGTIDCRQVAEAVEEACRVHPDRPVVAIVDYVQDAHAGEGKTRMERIDAASRELRDIVRRHPEQVTVLALAQVTETTMVEDAEGPSPVPYSKRQIRDSRSIYHQADFSMVVHRPWRYGSMSDCAVLQLDKNRYGREMHTAVSMDLKYKHASNYGGRTPSVPGLRTEEFRPEDSGARYQ